MSDLGARLRRSSEAVPPPGGDPVERLVHRRSQKRRNERFLAGVVALALVGGAIGGTVAVLSHVGRSSQGPAAGGNGSIRSIGPLTGAVPVLADGSYAYRTET